MKCLFLLLSHDSGKLDGVSLTNIGELLFAFSHRRLFLCVEWTQVLLSLGLFYPGLATLWSPPYYPSRLACKPKGLFARKSHKSNLIIGLCVETFCKCAAWLHSTISHGFRPTFFLQENSVNQFLSVSEHQKEL